MYRKLGTVLEVSKDAVRNPSEGSSGRTVFSVKTLLGRLSAVKWVTSPPGSQIFIGRFD
jgi:hypothetical protein